LSELLLEGAFRTLVRAGLRLSVRDYLAAMAALEAGFGVGSRAALLRLCQSLWARSDDEARLVKATFDRMPVATSDEVHKAIAARNPVNATAGAPPLSLASASDASPKEPTPQETRVRLQFTGDQAGLPLPRAVVKEGPGEMFLLSERPVIEERAMAIAWRRLHRPARAGASTEPDIEATAQAQARERVLAAPVLLPPRVNRARVVVLIDISPSMAAWRSFGLSLESALRQGRMARAAVYYFENVPDELWRERTPAGLVDLNRELADGEGSALLVFSDAGAARGRRNTERARSTGEFLRAVGSRWRPIVWLNPMPRARWQGTTAALIARQPGVSSFALGPTEFVRTIDVLRGQA
jgi:uncharacterized protein